MGKDKKRTGRLGVALLAICIMSVLFGWVAYAEDSPPDSPAVDQDVGGVAEKALSGSPLTQPEDPKTPSPLGILKTATKFMEQLSEGTLSFINNNTNSTLYGKEEVETSKAMITRHFDGYCAGVEKGNCPRDPLLQYGDVKISSLLSGTAYADGMRVRAAQDYLTNLFVPPSGPLVANFSGDLKDGALDIDTVVNDPKLLKKFAQALSDEAVLSVARQSFAHMMAVRMISNKDAGQTSEMQLMEAEAIKRFMSVGWLQKMNDPKTTPAEFQKEAILMQAYQNWMAYQQFRQLERIEALLATVLVQNARTMKTIAASIPTAPTSADTSSAAAGTGNTPTIPTSP